MTNVFRLRIWQTVRQVPIFAFYPFAELHHLTQLGQGKGGKEAERLLEDKAEPEPQVLV